MSSIIYNSILIENVLLQSIDQSPVYDEESGIDPIGIRTQAVFRGVLFAGSLTPEQIKLGHQVGLNLGAAGDILHKLNEPRKRFIYRFSNDDVLFDIRPSAVTPNTGSVELAGGAKDLNNGPRPYVRTERVIGSKAIHVIFGIEFWTWECNESNPVTNLRYYVSEDIDEDWYRTRTFQGRLRLRSRASHPHAFRNYVLPPLQGGFRRERITFREAPDGLSLIFQVVDRERDAAPPFPATTWRGNFSVSTYDGASVVEAVDVVLRGPPSVAKTDLLKLAFKIIDVKLGVLAKVNGEQVPVVIEDAMFNESLADNEVSASMRIRHAKEDPLTRLLHIGSETFGKPLPAATALDGNYDPGRFQSPIVPDSLSGLFTSAMQDPCHPASLNGTVVEQIEPGEEIDEEGDDREKDVASDIDSGIIQAYLNTDQQQSLYTDYRISSEVKQKSGVGTFPLSTAVQNQTAAPIRFHAGFAVRTIRVVAERVGQPPKLPAPVSFVDQTNGIAHELIDHSIESVGAKLSPDGVSKVYHVEMAIRYGLSRPLTATDLQYSGTLPYDTFQLEANMLPATVFVAPGTGGSLA